MTFIEILLIGFALSIDAYVVAISLAIYNKALKIKFLTSVSLLHFAMPFMGYLLSKATSSLILDYVDWVVFLIFAILGAKMVYSAIDDKEKESGDKLKESSLSTKGIYLISFALSIDSITAGYSIGLQKIATNNSSNDLSTMLYVSLIFGVCALALSATGVILREQLNRLNPTISEIIGGVILIIIGLKNIL